MKNKYKMQPPEELSPLTGIYNRSLRVGELGQLLALDNRVMFESTDTPSDHWPPPITMEELQEAYQRGDVFGGFFNENNQLIAFYWFEPKEGELYISVMGVDPDYQDRGIGQQILALTDNEARNRKLDKCSLSVDPFNGRAISAYLKSGYRVVDYRKAYFGEKYPNTDRFLMEKKLDGKQNELRVTTEVQCDDEVGLREAIDEGFVGVELVRSEDKDNRKNKIIFRK